MNILSTASLALTFALMVALGVGVPALGALCYSRFAAGMAVIFLTFCAEALYMQVGGIRLGISVYYTDLSLVFIGVVASLRLVLAHEFPRRHPAWLLFCAAVLLSVGSGLLTYGSPAGVQARPYVYFIVTALYAASFPMSEARLKLALNALCAVGIALVLLCIYRWVVFYTPITTLLPEEGVYNNDGEIRVIRSHEALVVAQALIVGMFFAGLSGTAMAARLSLPLLLAAVVTLQHRSVWLCALVGLLAAVWVAGAQRRTSTLAQLALLAGMAVLMALPLRFSEHLSGVSKQVGQSAQSALLGKGTAGERLSSWQAMLSNWSAAGPRAIALGQSFGTSNERYVEQQEGASVRKIDYMAHNFYVQTLNNTGVVGMATYLAAAAYTLVGLVRLCRAGVGGVAAQALLVVLIMQLAYYVPYGTDYLQSLLFGMGLAFVATHTREAATQRPAAGRAGPWQRWSWTG